MNFAEKKSAANTAPWQSEDEKANAWTWDAARTTLVLSAEGPLLETGIRRMGEWLSFTQRESNPVEELATMVATNLRETGLAIDEMEQVCYSGGPGSLLGLRCMTMLLDTWKTLRSGQPATYFRFSGMICAAYQIRKVQALPFRILSPWRENLWNCLLVDQNNPKEGDLEVISDPQEDVATYLLPHRKNWRTLPFTAREMVDFTVHSLFETDGLANRLTPTKAVEILTRETTSYKKWQPA